MDVYVCVSVCVCVCVVLYLDQVGHTGSHPERERCRVVPRFRRPLWPFHPASLRPNGHVWVLELLCRRGVWLWHLECVHLVPPAEALLLLHPQRKHARGAGSATTGGDVVQERLDQDIGLACGATCDCVRFVSFRFVSFRFVLFCFVLFVVWSGVCLSWLVLPFGLVFGVCKRKEKWSWS